jgi:hypothetical protein
MHNTKSSGRGWVIAWNERRAARRSMWWRVASPQRRAALLREAHGELEAMHAAGRLRWSTETREGVGNDVWAVMMDLAYPPRGMRGKPPSSPLHVRPRAARRVGSRSRGAGRPAGSRPRAPAGADEDEGSSEPPLAAASRRAVPVVREGRL